MISSENRFAVFQIPLWATWAGFASPPIFEADRALVRRQLAAELAVIVDVEPRRVGQAERGRGAGIHAIAALADAGYDDALGPEADLHRSQVLMEIVDELAVGGQVQDLLVEDEVASDLGSDHDARARERRRADIEWIEAANLLERDAGGADIFQCALGHDAHVVLGPVIADLGQRAVDCGAITRGRKSQASIPAGADLAEAVHHREGPGPGALVDRAAEAELRQIQRGGLKCERHVDIGVALVDGEAEIDTRREPRAKACDTAKRLALVADKVSLRIRPDRDAITLEPGAVARVFRARRRAAAAGIGPKRPVDAARCRVPEPLQEIRAEIERAVAGRLVVIGRGRHRNRRR